MSAMEHDPPPFHVFHKIPPGDGLYVRAKHAQVIDKTPDKAIALFRAAIAAGDRVDSALKDLALALKQQNRVEEAIQAISRYRYRCSQQSQDSLDNVLLDLYKRCGHLEDQIDLLIQKLELFQKGQAFNGKRTKTARSQGKKFQVSMDQEASRLLGNLGWAYMQQGNYVSAESAYRKALALEADNNKICNLGVCLMKQGKFKDAITVLRGASGTNKRIRGNAEFHFKSYQRSQELIMEANSMLRRGKGDPVFDIHFESSSPIDRVPNSLISVDNHKDATHISSARAAEAAGSVLSCSDHGDGETDRQGSHYDFLQRNSIDEGNDYFVNDYVLDESLFLPPSSLRPYSYSKFQVQVQEPKRLPVFRDLTILGHEAA